MSKIKYFKIQAIKYIELTEDRDYIKVEKCEDSEASAFQVYCVEDPKKGYDDDNLHIADFSSKEAAEQHIDFLTTLSPENRKPSIVSELFSKNMTSQTRACCDRVRLSDDCDTISSKNNLTQKFIRQLPIEFFYFDPNITVEEFAEFLCSKGIEAEESEDTVDTVDVVVCDSTGVECFLEIHKGQYYSDEYDYRNTKFSQEEIDELFKRIE